MVPPGNDPTARQKRCGMAVTKEQVLACLQGIKSPEGIPLPDTGTLSDVVATDGKVFFSISVDAAPDRSRTTTTGST